MFQRVEYAGSNKYFSNAHVTCDSVRAAIWAISVQRAIQQCSQNYVFHVHR